MSRKGSLKDEMAAEMAELAPSRQWFPIKKRPREQSAPSMSASSGPAGSVEVVSSDEEDSLDDDLFRDEQDRAEMALLAEAKREQIFYERSERRKDMIERNRIRRERREKAGLVAKADVEEPPTKKRRETGKRKALDDIASKRRAKEQRERALESDEEESDYGRRKKLGKNRRGEEDDDFIVDDMDVDERQRGDRAALTAPKEPEVDITLADLKRAIVRRHQLERWYDEPYWNKVIRGLYVRVGIGENRFLSGADKNVYRIAEIVDLHESGKVYKLGNKECRHQLVVKCGGRSKAYEMKYVSNQGITPDEFIYFLEHQKKVHEPVPTRREVEALEAQILMAEKYVYTDEDIAEQVRKNKARMRDPVHLAKEKMRLMQEIEIERENKNVYKVEELQRQLDDLLEREREKIEREMSAKAIKISELNEKGRKRYNQTMDETRSLLLKIEKEEMEGKISVDDNPFARRKTVVIHKFHKKDGDEDGGETTDAVSPAPAPGKTPTPPPTSTPTLQQTASTPSTPFAPSSASSAPSPALRPLDGPTPKKVLSLADYKSRRSSSH